MKQKPSHACSPMTTFLLIWRYFPNNYHIDICYKTIPHTTNYSTNLQLHILLHHHLWEWLHILKVVHRCWSHKASHFQHGLSVYWMVWYLERERGREREVASFQCINMCALSLSTSTHYTQLHDLVSVYKALGLLALTRIHLYISLCVHPSIYIKSWYLP